MNDVKQKKRRLNQHDPTVNHHHLSSGDYIFIKKDNAMSNKLEQRALEQINKIDEGIFSGFLEKLISGRLKKQLKVLEKDPQLKASFERFEKSVEDLQHDVEVFTKIAMSEENPEGYKPKSSEKKRIDAYEYIAKMAKR